MTPNNRPYGISDTWVMCVPEFTVGNKLLLEALNTLGNTPAQSLALETLHRIRDINQARSTIATRATFDHEYAAALEWLEANMTDIQLVGAAPVVNNSTRLDINADDLLAHVEELLAEAAEDTTNFMGAVNWGCLGVVDIEYRLSMLTPNDGPWCVVIVSEASPDCALLDWLNDRLDQERFPFACIVCEW